MNFRKVLYFLGNLILITILFNFIHFVFTVFISLDVAVSAVSLFDRPPSELRIFEIRKIWVLILSIFLTCFIDFVYLKNLLKPLKLEKYSNRIFEIIGIITEVLIIGLFIFCKVYPL